jgi:methylmalonyl-CoA epimerase
MTHRQLDHIAIVVDNLTESLAFYEKQLGLVCEHIEELAERGIRIAMLPIGNTRIELIEAMNDHSEVSSFMAKRGPGIHHICLTSDDVARDMERMDVKFTTAHPSSGADGKTVAFIHPKSSGGVLIELSQ